MRGLFIRVARKEPVRHLRCCHQSDGNHAEVMKSWSHAQRRGINAIACRRGRSRMLLGHVVLTQMDGRFQLCFPVKNEQSRPSCHFLSGGVRGLDGVDVDDRRGTLTF